jgi:hypothetical protein
LDFCGSLTVAYLCPKILLSDKKLHIRFPA